jgi:hypothetical protein
MTRKPALVLNTVVVADFSLLFHSILFYTLASVSWLSAFIAGFSQLGMRGNDNDDVLVKATDT